MSPASFELPLKAGEAASLADLTMQVLENRRAQDDLRNRLAARSTALNLTSIRPYWGSLQQDPVHANAFYLAVDGLSAPKPQPMLLRFALASAPASPLFPASRLVGRMRPGAGLREVVVNAVPFGPGDTEAIETFAGQVDRAFLPRPQGSAPSITAITGKPETEVPALFEGFRLVMKSTGLNVASIGAPPGRATETLAASVWSAIRAGWRNGFNVEAEPLDPVAPDFADAVRTQSAFTRFRLPVADTGGALAPDLLGWALDDFGRRFAIAEQNYTFDPDEVKDLAAHLGPALVRLTDAVDLIRRERVAAGLGRAFDLEIVMPDAAGRRELLFCLHWLKAQGRPAQQVSAHPESVAEARARAAIARHFGATLSFDADSLPGLPGAAQWSGARWNCRLRGEHTVDRVVATVAALRS